MSLSGTDDRVLDTGTVLGFLAYASWGVLPIYFRALEPAGAFEIVAQRIVWSLIFCALLLALRRDIAWIRGLPANPGSVGILAVASLLLAINWGATIYAVTVNRVVEGALGYFINPIVFVLFGVVVLHERVRPLQCAAVALGAVAVAIIALDYGRPPWIAVIVTCAFTTYGYLKKRAGADVPALHGMAIETAVLTPLALITLLVLNRQGESTWSTQGFTHMLLLVMTGIVTAVPLIWFAAAAGRMPLTTIGLLQFVTPVLQFIVGVAVFHEHMPIARWIGFALVWCGLVLLTIDLFRAVHTNRENERPR